MRRSERWAREVRGGPPPDESCVRLASRRVPLTRRTHHPHAGGFGSFSVLLALALSLGACARPSVRPARPVAPAVFAPSARQVAFLDTLQERTFRWIWDESDPRTGLTQDRAPHRAFASIAATGFALTAYPIGVERGFVTRDSARARVLSTMRFFWTAPQGPAVAGMAGYKGFFYHFLVQTTGERYRDVELSTIDTALLLGGVLFCQSYFDRADAGETEIRALADSIYRRVDWTWLQPRAPLVSMGWVPETPDTAHGYDWRGLDEAMILYVLALGSPTHPIDGSAWTTWTSTYKWGTYYGQAHVGFGPLFGHQYSHLWIDFRGIQDAYMREKGIDYFENARRATLAQRSYAIDNPHEWSGYGADFWGFSASDGPADTTVVLDGKPRRFFTYAARAVSFTENRDDGTVTPTATGGSVAFAPEVTIPTLVHMRERYGDALFTRYGFLDAINPTFSATGVPPVMGRNVPGGPWIDGDHLGIDQGPILAMIENYRTGLVWRVMRRNPYIRRGLERAGFTGGWLATDRN